MKTGKDKDIVIIFFPHATTFDNEAGISTGAAEAQISPKGKHQIKGLHEVVSKQKFDTVYSSDMVRAIETAQGAFGISNRIEVDGRLREIDIGELTGKKDNYTEPLAHKYIDEPFPGGESYRDVETRIKSFLDDLITLHPGQRVALVGHQGTQLALDVLLKDLTWKEALEKDWRKRKAFQYGWEYVILGSSANNSHNRPSI